MSKWVTIAIIVLFVPVLSLCADDTIRFQIDFVLSNGVVSNLSILPINGNYSLEEIVSNAEYRRSFSNNDDEMDSEVEYDICKLQYYTNLVGTNYIIVEATPLYSVDLADKRLNKPSVGYKLFFYEMGVDEHDEPLRVDYSDMEIKTRSDSMYLQCDVPSVFEGEYCTFEFYVGASFIDLENMAGRYTSTLTIGVEAQ